MSKKYTTLSSHFPEHASKIKTLKKKDPHFAKLAKRYKRNSRKMQAFESGAKSTSDFRMEDLKKKRLYLLDIINHILINTNDQGNQDL